MVDLAIIPAIIGAVALISYSLHRKTKGNWVLSDFNKTFEKFLKDFYSFNFEYKKRGVICH